MKKKLLTLLIGVSLVLALIAVPLMTACAPEVAPPEVPEVPEEPEVAPKVLKIGWNDAMTGPYSGWCLPSLTGAEIWVANINAAGGLRVGDDIYMVELFTYDNEFLPTKAVLGAKKLVLEDGVDLMLAGWGEPLIAQQPFLTEQKILNFAQNPTAIGPDSPYQLSLAGMFPTQGATMLDYAIDTYGVERVAYARVDWSISEMSAAYYWAVLEARGIEVVYYELYSADMTDAAPLISAVLATDPELIIFGEILAGPLIYEQLYIQGFEGITLGSSLMVSNITAKVPVEWLEARKAIAVTPDWDDPMMSDKCNKFYADWLARYGPGGPEDQNRTLIIGDWMNWVALDLWQWAVESVGSIDGTIVRDFLLAQETLPHAIGPAVWWGKDVYRVNHTLLYEHPITEIINGRHTVVDMRSVSDWWETGDNAALTLKYMAEFGAMWWQQL